MGNDGSLGTQNGNEEEKVRPPNRTSFQKELSRINREIEVLQQQAKTLLDKDGGPGSITEVRLAKEKIRTERSGLAEMAEKVKKEIVKLRKQREGLKTSRLEVEKECRVRSQDKLETYMKNCEDRYNSANLSRKEESLLVEEMNELKRNRNKLEKLTEIIRSLTATDEKINKLSEENRETYREIFRLKAEQHRQAAEQRERTVKWHHVRQSLDEYHREKRDLIADYKTNRENYAEWMKKHRKKALSSNSSYPATFPNIKRSGRDNAEKGQSRDSISVMEDEELEPFFEQKRDCTQLIAYLERLCTKLDTADPMVSTSAAAQDSDSDSADDFPSSFARLHVLNKKTENQPKIEQHVKQKKQSSRKVKPTQAISHSFGTYNLFGSIEVVVPVIYQEVPKALEEVKQKLVFYNHQTNVIDWYEEFKDFEATLRTMSRSVSEYTGDSACIDSETASLASSRLHPSSPGEIMSFRLSSFNHDEGFEMIDPQKSN